MDRATSIYLDLLRFLSALTVFLAHASYQRFTGNPPFLSLFTPLGHDAVVVFFVLSGYVISYSASCKDDRLSTFIIRRFARLYSVVVPALLITIVADYIGLFAFPPLYQGWWFQDSYPIIRVLSTLSFTNELWFVSIRPFSNGPFWSIGYEFWFYVAFALAFYFRGLKRLVLLALFTLIVGPKILLLLPVWLMGTLAYRVNTFVKLSSATGWFLITSSLVFYLLYRLSGGHELLNTITLQSFGEQGFHQLFWSRSFLSSYILGLLVVANFIGFKAISHQVESLLYYFQKPIKYCASFTFTLYLLHYPLLQLFTALSYNNELGYGHPLFVLTATMVSIVLMAEISEKKKHHYVQLFNTIYTTLVNWIRYRHALINR